MKRTSLLGLEIDDNLTWNTQVKMIKSYNAKVGQLKKDGIFVNKFSRGDLFQNNLAAVAYGMTVWWTFSPVHTEDLDRMDVRAASIIHRLSKNIPEEEIIRSVKSDRLDYNNKSNILSMMYKI